MERRTRGPGAHHDRRAAEIAEAVLAMVADEGLAAVSQSRVAARAGVSAGRVQHYFPTKQRLLQAAFEHANALSAARITARTGDVATSRQVLTVVLTELIPHDPDTHVHMRVRQAFTALALTDPAIATRLHADYTRLHQQLADLLAHDGVSDPLPTAIALAALAEGLAYYVLTDLCSAQTARDRILTAVDDAYGHQATGSQQ
ncbi:TetR/AcrR family transcriptional regulator [Actinomadura kijaniata]|uniref:TetR/AcrR family transcriptional regulator n=1 Tax=Actinomadura kijaniata TaxID=46161 RepID=UPI0008337720|nr:TetR family transcriptional regulator C-terminal domain-containing protein [Actinomadura kijaniata]